MGSITKALNFSWEAMEGSTWLRPIEHKQDLCLDVFIIEEQSLLSSNSYLSQSQG